MSRALPSAPLARRVLLAATPLLLLACEAAEREEIHRGGGRRVALDVTNAIARRDSSWSVSLETRLDQAVESPEGRWNREVTRLLLRCAPLGERVVRTSRFLDDGRMLYDQPGDLRDSSWRAPSDTALMRRACERLGAR